MSGDFEGQAAELIPADVRMISGCQDSQTSADVSNVASFQLPDPAGRSGGACTSALLRVLYNENGNDDMSFVQVLTEMRQLLNDGKYTQIPQLSSSRKMDVNENFRIVPDGFSGTKRAVLIGINYVGQQGQLSGCHNDVGNIKDYLVEKEGFDPSNITILMDDGNNIEPTYQNIVNAFSMLTSETTSGDCSFVHYSGHGGRVKDLDGDEDDGYDETLIPVDYQSAGQIRDDDVYTQLVGRMPEGSTLTCLMDCCHSGTVLDLPYCFKADGEQTNMEENPKIQFGDLKKTAIAFLIARIFGQGMISSLIVSLLVGGSSSSGGGGDLISIGTLRSVLGTLCGR